MERFFQILAAVLAGTAAYFYFGLGDVDKTFLTTVGGCVAFFLSVRAGVRKRLDERAASEAAAEREVTDAE